MSDSDRVMKRLGAKLVMKFHSVDERTSYKYTSFTKVLDPGRVAIIEER